MKPNVGESECRAAAESLLGCGFDEFRPIHGGNSSLNFLAAAAGKSWFVKCGPRGRVESVLRRLAAVKSAYSVGVAAEGRTAPCGEWAVCAMDWCDGGAPIDPAQLEPESIASLARAYREFHAAIQAVADAKDTGVCRRFDAGMAPCVIHGDLNFRNIGFRRGEVAVFFDFESMRIGYPTEDLLRVSLHAMERTRFWRLGRTRRLEECLAGLVRHSGYSRRAWLAAVDVYETIKRGKRKGKSAFPALKSFENVLRAPLYNRVRAIIRKEAAE